MAVKEIVTQTTSYKLGDVQYHPLSKNRTEPFGLYVEDNPLFDEYDNVPLTVVELTQRVISTAAHNFDTPVWFTQCIDADNGTFLPFSSTLSHYPKGVAVPVILNARLFEADTDQQRSWPVILKIPSDDGGYLLKEAFLYYERGAVVTAADVYGAK